MKVSRASGRRSTRLESGWHAMYDSGRELSC